MASFGGFQFDNLVQARIPFLFLNLGIDTSKVYPHVHKMHLDRTLFMMDGVDLESASTSEIVQALQDSKTPLSTAIVVLDRDGSKAAPIATALEQVGFTNAFYVAGGWDQLVVDKEQGF
jgi:hypothetical protein